MLALNRCGYNNDSRRRCGCGAIRCSIGSSTWRVSQDQHVERRPLAVSYRLAEGDEVVARRVEVDERTRRVTRFVEKPCGDGNGIEAGGHPRFTYLKPAVALAPTGVRRARGRQAVAGFTAWSGRGSIIMRESPSVRLPGCFLVDRGRGAAGLLGHDRTFECGRTLLTYSGALGRGRLTTRAHARVGLFGNPSDGYGGKP